MSRYIWGIMAQIRPDGENGQVAGGELQVAENMPRNMPRAVGNLQLATAHCQVIITWLISSHPVGAMPLHRIVEQIPPKHDMEHYPHV